MREHKECTSCGNLFSDGTEAFGDGKCPYCIECSKCDGFITGDFDEMWSHHVEKHNHNPMNPLHPPGNFESIELTGAMECTCSPH